MDNSQKMCDIGSAPTESFIEEDFILTRTRVSWFLMLPGYLNSRSVPNSHWYKRCYRWLRVISIITIIVYMLVAFNGFWNLTWLIVDPKLPFTLFINILWEVRWIITSMITAYFLHKKYLEEFYKLLKIPTNRWEKYRTYLNYFIPAIIIIHMILPCITILIDVNMLDNEYKVQRSIVVILFALFRVIVLPGIGMLILTLYLLDKNIVAVREKIEEAESFANIDELVTNMRKVIRKTEGWISPLVGCHMFLLYLSIIPTLLSGFELFETIPSPSTLHILNITESTEREFVEVLSKLKIDSDKYNRVYIVAGVHEEMELRLTRNTLISDTNNKTEHQPYQNVRKQNYRFRVKGIADTAFTIAEILNTFLLPLYLMNRIKQSLYGVLNAVWDKEVGLDKNFLRSDQKTIAKKIKDTKGIRILGIEVELFKAIFLGAVAPFVGLLLKLTLKHFNIE